VPRKPSTAKRSLVLAAARSLFIQKGFQATSMDEVAATAAVSKMTVYAHFRNKEGLFGAILDEERARAPSREASRGFEPTRSPATQLMEVATARLLELFEPSRFQVARMVLGETLRTPELTRQFGRELDAHSELLVPWLQAATRHGVLEVADPALQSRLFWKGVLGVAFWPAMLRGEPDLTPDLHAQLSLWVDAFVAALAPRSPT